MTPFDWQISYKKRIKGYNKKNEGGGGRHAFAA